MPSTSFHHRLTRMPMRKTTNSPCIRPASRFWIVAMGAALSPLTAFTLLLKWRFRSEPRDELFGRSLVQADELCLASDADQVSGEPE